MIDENAKTETDKWGCAKVATTNGPIYIVPDEKMRERYAKGGRLVFSKAEIEPCLRAIASWPAWEKHQWLAEIRLVKDTFPLSVVEPPVRKLVARGARREEESRDEERGGVQADFLRAATAASGPDGAPPADGSRRS